MVNYTTLVIIIIVSALGWVVAKTINIPQQQQALAREFHP